MTTQGFSLSSPARPEGEPAARQDRLDRLVLRLGAAMLDLLAIGASVLMEGAAVLGHRVFRDTAREDYVLFLPQGELVPHLRTNLHTFP